MSTPNNPPSIEDLLAQELAEADKAAGLEPVAKPASEAKPITITVHGQKLTFADETELAAQMEKLVGQVTEAKRKPVAAPPPEPKPAEPLAADAKVKKFADLLVQDPGDAVLDAWTEKTGVSADQLKSLPQLMQAVELIQRKQTTDDFMRAHSDDYVPTPENAQALLGVMEQMKLGYTPEGLEAAYAVAKTRNLLKVPDVVEQVDDAAFAPAPRRAAAPPRPTRSAASAAPTIYDRAEDLSTEQLERILRQFNNR